jgi:class 3 adenylate cyclase
MARTFTAQELSEETRVSVERIRWFVDIGLIDRRDPERFTAGDGFRCKMVEALLASGVMPDQIETAVRTGALNLRHVDAYILREPGPRSERTFGAFAAASGRRGAQLAGIYQVFGIPPPRDGDHLPLDEEELLSEFLEAWRVAPDDRSLARAARLVAEGTRLPATGWPELFDEQVAAPARDRLVSGELDAFPPEAMAAIARLFHLIPRLTAWLTDRYVEQLVVAGIVEHLQEFLSSRGLAPAPPPGPPPAVVFVDVSGYTRMTEELGDESAARTSELLRERAESVAEASGGRLVKLLGDGAMLAFRDPGQAVAAAARLVRELDEEAGLAAHAGIQAGPVVQRDLDLFGRTVNMASRIAARAGPGEVLVSSEVAELVGDGFGFEAMPAASLKGIDQPVALFRVLEADE